jgi:hypothetical protein
VGKGGNKRAVALPATQVLRSPASAALVLLTTALVAALNLTSIYNNDFWLQLKVGQMIRADGVIPRTILFCFTQERDLPFVAHEWLSSVITSWLYDHTGYGGMVMFKCFLSLVMAALVFRLSWRLNHNLQVTCLVVAFVSLFTNFRLHMRPETFAFILFLCSLNVLHEFAVSGRRWWLLALAPIAILWVNMHGSFLVNIVLIPLFLLGAMIGDAWQGIWSDPGARRRRAATIYGPLAVATLATALLSLVNPYGYHLWQHAFALSQAGFVRRHIVEFAATFDPRIQDFFYVNFTYACMMAVLFSFAVARRRTTATAVLLCAAFAVIALQAIRYAAWLGVASTYIMGVNLGGVGMSPRGRRAFTVTLSLLLLAGLLLVVAEGNVRGMPVGLQDRSPLPTAAVDYLRSAGITGNVFTSYALADQIVYHFYPEIKVSIDSRNDAYGEAYYLKHRSLTGRSRPLMAPVEDLLDFLETNNVRTIVTRPFDFSNWREAGFLPRLEEVGWKVAYNDERSIVLRRY